MTLISTHEYGVLIFTKSEHAKHYSTKLGKVEFKNYALSINKNKRRIPMTTQTINLTPLGDRVIIKPMPSEEITKGGVILPETAKEKPQKGEVVAVGKGKYTEEGKLIEMEVKPGDTVLYGKYAGTEIKYEGEEYLIAKQSEILAIIS
jgi:chaperonin GroES